MILAVTDASHAVFLSYASQDAEPAQKICEALRAAGIEVFLDQSELRGGDVWDQKIRREIHDCALFIPVISTNTASRHEGYFRLEWDLADQRTHMIARSRVFVVPVCLDTTTEVAADVPESFRRVQWTRLPGGETPPAFIERIKRLLSPELSPVSAVPAAVPAFREPVRASRSSKPLLLVIVGVLVLAALAYWVADRFWISKHPNTSAADAASRATAEPGAATAFNPPPHSIAVLPFVNLSGDPSQDYFSDGLTEELLNSLAEINELQVAARTSSFSFKEHPDIATVAHKLNVGAVLEGSVRRSAHTLRITAQLINAVTGFHVWSKTYDRDLGDVLKLQTEIATAVASALKVTLLGDVAAKVELGGTHNPAAFDAYLRGAKAYSSRRDAKDLPAAIAAYTEAIRLDPTMRSHSSADRLPFPLSPRRPRPQRRRVTALTRRKPMHARRSHLHRIWLKLTPHWRPFRKVEPSTSRRRARNTIAPWHLRRAMHRYCEVVAGSQPTWGTSMRASQPPAAPSCSTRSLAQAIPRARGRCI